MKNVLKNLLKIKSIVTIAVTGVFIYCTINGTLSTEQIMVIVTMVITFYFAKNGGGGSNDGDIS